MSPSLIPAETVSVARPPVHEGRPKGDRQRQLLLALVASNPGVHVLRAAALLGLNWNTCLHHVRRLEGAGLVTVRKVSGRVCLFDRKSGSASSRIGNLLLRDERNMGLARLLIESPGVNQKSLAGSLGVAASVAHYRLVRLEEAGLIQRVNRGREVCVFPTEAMESAYRAAKLNGAPVPAQPETTDAAVPNLLFGLPVPTGDSAADALVADPADTDADEIAVAALPTPFDVDAPVASA